MNIDVKEIDTSNPVRDAYYQWAKDIGFRNRPCNDYMNLYRDFVENKPIRRSIFRFETPDWADGLEFYHLFVKLPDFLTHDIKRKIMSSIKYKPLEFTGKVFEDEAIHPWDNDKPNQNNVDFIPCTHFIVDSLNDFELNTTTED